MKNITLNGLCVLLILISNTAFAQTNLLKTIFSDKDNFALTTEFGNKMPKTFLVIDSTQEWYGKRFKLPENLKDTAVMNRILNDEHHPYNHTYIFKDSLLNSLFDDGEKEDLFIASQQQKPRLLKSTEAPFKLIKSYKNVKNGFFFSISDILYSNDKKYAFINIYIYRKTSKRQSLDDTSYGSILLVYQKISNNNWQKLKSLGHLIL